MTLATITITTRNRCEEALRAVASSLAQDFPALEVLVIDDASDDGTAQRIKARFPQARVIALGERAGLVANRNRGFIEANGKYVFSLDDDAYFTRPDIVARAVALFERDALIGAVAIPFIEPAARRSRSSLAHPSRLEPGGEVRSYCGCAHAVRRDVALGLGGYRAFFVHQGEEQDLCLRMRAAGWRVVYGDCGPVVHMVSPHRDTRRMLHYGARNQILFEGLNAPLSQLPARLARAIAGTLRYRFSWSTTPLKLTAILAGFVETAMRLPERRPVPTQVYREFRSLPGHGPEPWAGDMPPPCHERQVAA